MYKDFYGLKEEPFPMTSDPRFLYWSPKHQEAFRHLVYGVQSKKGLAVLTGEPGTGKTAIVQAVTAHLRARYPGVHIALLGHSTITVQDFFRLVFDEFGLDHSTQSKSIYLIKLKNFLIHNHQKNRKNIVMLDEAHNLHAALLEEIRLLSNMELAGEKLLHIFLVGRPPPPSMQTPHLGQLRQRSVMRYNLLPLNRLETELYIHKRLRVAGAQAVDMFRRDALEEIFVCAQGFPRLINILCANALLFGCSTHTYQIGRDLIRRVAAVAPVVPPTPPPTGLHQPEQTAWPTPQPAVREHADRIIRRQTVFSKADYRDYWESLLPKNPRQDNHLRSTRKRAAERASQQRWWRVLLIAVALLGLLGGIVGTQRGWWSLRVVVDRTVEMVRQRVAR